MTSPKNLFPSPHVRDVQTESQSFSNPKFFSLNALRSNLSNLSISTKISCGYAVALGVAVLGTIVGVTLGTYYQHKATTQRAKGYEEHKTLGNLQVNMLAVKSHQQDLLLVLDQPEEFQKNRVKLLDHLQNVKKNLVEAHALSEEILVEDPDRLLQEYDRVVEVYTQELLVVLKKIEPTRLQPETAATVLARQKLLLEFIDTPIAHQFSALSFNITPLIRSAQIKVESTEAVLDKAERARSQTLTVSILLSVLIASVLAERTSQTIAYPIKFVTNIAKRATQNSDFDLQVPITTHDEVGQLATSLNQLIQKVKILLEEQKAEASRQLIQSEKMSSLGQMMAGVAHEINNPVNFIYGNLEHTTRYFSDLLALLNAYEAKASEDEIREQVEDIDLEFLKEDLPKSLNSMKVGADRVRQIVLSLKNFSRLDEAKPHLVDLSACLDSTLLILNNRIKINTNIVRHYGNIPPIEGFAGALYQVFMNLLSNALDALDQNVAISQTPQLDNSPLTPEILISTARRDENWVEVIISDNGPGMPDEIQRKIFEAFFTTKPIGIGTGLGLSISHQIIVEKHGGQLTCQSELGKGTTFTIALPIQQRTTAEQTT